MQQREIIFDIIFYFNNSPAFTVSNKKISIDIDVAFEVILSYFKAVKQLADLDKRAQIINMIKIEKMFQSFYLHNTARLKVNFKQRSFASGVARSGDNGQFVLQTIKT